MRLLIFLISLFLSGCIIAPYKVDIQQGNYVNEDMVLKLKLNMTREQVLFAMGTPLIIDPFHPDRWDYVYMTGEAGKVKRVRGVTLEFEGDQLARIDGDIPIVREELQKLLDSVKKP
ncbi:MAG: outer membrane protein assembly factor BamE [Burkholderiales bacterium]|jgi:outer membrane protein assembly factor BamE